MKHVQLNRKLSLRSPCAESVQIEPEVCEVRRCVAGGGNLESGVGPPDTHTTPPGETGLRLAFPAHGVRATKRQVQRRIVSAQTPDAREDE